MTLQSMILSKKVRETLKKDIISVIAIMNKVSNPRKIARKIIPFVKKEVEFEPKLESVAKIVERYVDEVEKTGELSGYDIKGIENLMVKTQVTLQSDIGVIVMRIIKNIGNIFIKIIQMAYSDRERPFINVSLSHSYATVMVEQSIFEKAVTIIGKDNIIYKKKNQVAIGVVTPADVVDVPGYTGYVLSLLGINGVNIVDLLSSYREGLIITDEKNAQKAYAILRSEIERLRLYHKL